MVGTHLKIIKSVTVSIDSTDIMLEQIEKLFCLANITIHKRILVFKNNKISFTYSFFCSKYILQLYFILKICILMFVWVNNFKIILKHF